MYTILLIHYQFRFADQAPLSGGQPAARPRVERSCAARYNRRVKTHTEKGGAQSMELWDAYLPDGRKAGRTLTRGEPVPAGLFHLVADELVKHTDGAYLVMQRDFRKNGYPGLFEAGASGAVRMGETPYEGALRELRGRNRYRRRQP